MERSNALCAKPGTNALSWRRQALPYRQKFSPRFTVTFHQLNHNIQGDRGYRRSGEVPTVKTIARGAWRYTNRFYKSRRLSEKTSALMLLWIIPSFFILSQWFFIHAQLVMTQAPLVTACNPTPKQCVESIHMMQSVNAMPTVQQSAARWAAIRSGLICLMRPEPFVCCVPLA